jgi:cathepsin L
MFFLVLSAVAADLQLFSVWAQNHQLRFGSHAEYMKRYHIFMDSRKKVMEHNAQGKTYSLEINKFSHLTDEEFSALYLHKDITIESVDQVEENYVPLTNVPDSKDWVAEGCVTPVKDQGSCGSCWAFSVTAAMEAHHLLQKGCRGVAPILLSEQMLVDCSRSAGNQGCNGGIRAATYTWIKSNGGIQKEADYPYKAKDMACVQDKSKFVMTVVGATDLPNGNEVRLKEVIGTIGPMGTGVYVLADFQRYSSGVYYNSNCPRQSTNHAVFITGYGTDASSGMDYWVIKNSWGVTWGNKGYIWMARNKDNHCAVARNANYLQGITLL